MTKSLEDMQQEFLRGSLKMQATMVNPFKSKETKRKTLCKFTDSLSEETFNQFIPEIITIINMKKDICKEYADSGTQVDGILKWLPRMEAFKELLQLTVKQHRQKHGFSN